MLPRLIWALAAVFGSILTGSLSAQASPSDDVVPCRVLHLVPPDYPQREAVNGIDHGEARLMLQIDVHGKLSDALAVAYSHRGFADEALRAVREWRFAPSLVGGQPAWSTIEVRFEYHQGNLASVSLGAAEEPHLEAGQYQFEAVSPQQLDRPLRPLKLIAPTYARAWQARGMAGSVRLRFYVDEDGCPRMPSVVRADYPEMGWAAIAALEKWRFTPPTRGGQPVLVQMEQDFSFGPDSQETPSGQ